MQISAVSSLDTPKSVRTVLLIACYVSSYNIFNDALSSSGYVRSIGEMISEWYRPITTNVDGKNYGLCESTVTRLENAVA
jgi:hypothetical protein